MAIYKTTTFALAAFGILLNVLEINSIRCYECVNCNKTNSQIVTCSFPNNTISTTPLTSTNSPLSSTSTTNSSTTPSTVPNNTSSKISYSNSGDEGPNVVRAEWSLELENGIEDYKDNVCVCGDGICSCNERASIHTNLSLVCATDTYTDNGVKIVNKGCAVNFHNNTNTCILSGYTSNCKTCSKDLCNFGSSLTTSTVLLATAMISVIKLFN